MEEMNQQAVPKEEEGLFSPDVEANFPETVSETGELPPEEAVPEAPPPPPPTIELTVSTDKMAAYIRVKTSFEGQEVTPDFVLDFLHLHDIIYGVKEKQISDFCAAHRFFAELCCAQGVPPVHQEAASILFKFNTSNEAKPKEREDGTVDFRDLGLVQNVEKGAELCRVLMPPDGRDGIDIYDNAVPHRHAAIPAFPSGKNTEISEDGLTLLASIDGCVDFLNRAVNVEDVFNVKGDVDISSGNIDFTGSVNVRGDVREGFSIKAGGDVMINGMAEGSFIESGGSIAISNGMNGMLRGLLRAEHDVTGKYFENTTIECGGCLYADVLLNCTVRTKGSVVLKGKKALLIGGNCTAGRVIYANTIGSSNHIHTNTTISSPDLNRAIMGDKKSPEDLEQEAKLLAKIEALKKAGMDIQAKIQQLLGSAQKSENERMAVKSLMAKKAQYMGSATALEKELAAKKQKETDEKVSPIDFRIVAIGRIFPGVKLTVGPFTQNLDVEYSNTKVYADPENLVFSPVSAEDKMDLY